MTEIGRGSSGRTLLTIHDVAEFLRIDPKTVRRLVKSQRLAAYKVGRQWRISERDLWAYLTERRNEK